MIAQFDLADQKEQQRREKQQKLAGRRRQKGNDRHHDVGRRLIDAAAGVAAEQRILQFVQRGQRLHRARRAFA